MRRITPVALISMVLTVIVLHALATPAGLVPGGVETANPAGDTSVGGGDAAPGLTTVWRSNWLSFGFEGPTYLIIQTQEEWNALWARAADGTSAPQVDFASRTVLVAIYGTARTSGYGIEITEVVPTADGTVALRVETSVVGPRCAALEVLTYPVHMVSISKSDGPFRFQTESISVACD